MNKLFSRSDEVDRELFVITGILKDLVVSKHEYDPSWQDRLKDLDNVMQHICNRRYGQPIEKT